MPTIQKQTNGPKKKKPKGVLSRIKPIGSNSDETLKILIYGRSGTGKTTLWATFPKRTLAIICSGSKKSGEVKSILTPEYKKVIDEVVLHSPDELREIVEEQKRTGKYETLVLDHASDFQNLVLKEVLGLDELPEQMSWGIATRNEHGTCALKMKEYLRALLNLQCNVCIIAQERLFMPNEDSLIGKSYIAAGVTESVVGWLNPAVDHVVQTFICKQTVIKKVKVGKKVKEIKKETGKFEYCLRTDIDGIHEIKLRVPKEFAKTDVIVNPTYKKILQVIKGEV